MDFRKKALSTLDYRKVRIILTEKDYNSHEKKHKEIREEFNLVKKTIESPDAVYYSETHKNRFCYFKKSLTGKNKNKFMRVVIAPQKHLGKEIGIVCSAHFRDKIIETNKIWEKPTV